MDLKTIARRPHVSELLGHDSDFVEYHGVRMAVEPTLSDHKQSYDCIVTANEIRKLNLLLGWMLVI